MGSQNLNSRNAFSTPGTISNQKTSKCLPPKSSQKQEFETSQKCQQKQRMEEPNLPGDEQDGALSPGILSTPGTRENSPSTEKTDGYAPKKRGTSSKDQDHLFFFFSKSESVPVSE
jgi:hypothetical protein